MKSSRIIRTILATSIFFAGPFVAGATTAGDVGDPQGRCGTFPAAVYQLIYAGWADCWLRKVGEKPLWKGLTDPRVRQRVRFTFTDGHFRYVRVINFTELSDGTGKIEVKTITPPDGGGYQVRDRRQLKVSAENVRRLNDLAVASDAWKFETGTWDGEEMYLHCQTLDMERVDRSGYRFSSVSISCNRPRKLEPLVDFLTGMAGLNLDRAAY